MCIFNVNRTKCVCILFIGQNQLFEYIMYILNHITDKCKIYLIPKCNTINSVHKKKKW